MQPSLEIITLYSPQGLFHLLSQKSSLRLPICEMEPLQHQGTRIHPLQAQGRKVLTPPEDSLLPATPLPATPYPSQLEFGDPTPHQACCKSLIMFISNAAFFFFFFATANTGTYSQSLEDCVVTSLFFIFSGRTSWVSRPHKKNIVKSYWRQEPGVVPGTKENRSWKKRLLHDGNWDIPRSCC